MENIKKSRAFELGSFLWLVVLAATAGAVLTVIIFFPARAQAQGPATTQSYIPARYALETAEINVNMQQPYGNNTQKMLFKLNTATGEVWVMQLSTISITNPQILSAGWVKVVKNVQTPNILQQF